MRPPLPLAAVAVVLCLSLSGCAGGEQTFSLAGTFTEDRTDGDIQEVVGLGEARGGEVVILESFPEQFQVRGLARDDCDGLREVLAGKPYVDLVRECAVAEGGADPY